MCSLCTSLMTIDDYNEVFLTSNSKSAYISTDLLRSFYAFGFKPCNQPLFFSFLFRIFYGIGVFSLVFQLWLKLMRVIDDGLEMCEGSL